LRYRGRIACAGGMRLCAYVRACFYAFQT